MSQDWADKTAGQLLRRAPIQTGICLILGGSDTGKTTLAAVLTGQLAGYGSVGIIDADIGQSHIGPPATVGWAVVDKPQVDFTNYAVGGISFVGDVTPVGHLLQLTTAITQCVQQVSKKAELIIIDTPGFITGPSAAALWWTVQRILQPRLILAVQHNDELSDILSGIRSFDTQLELIESLPQMPTKSPQERRNYRQSRFIKYFQDSRLYNISLNGMAIQQGRNSTHQGLVSRAVGLRDKKGEDIAMGVIVDWRDEGAVAVIRSPEVDIRRICCLVIGDVAIDIADGVL